MKSKAGKVPWKSHPLLGIVVGPLLAFAYAAVETRVTPWALVNIGPAWSWLRHVLFFASAGWLLKLLWWKQLPRHFFIEAMTPAEFAGATPEAVQQQKQLSARRAPLPEIENGVSSPTEKPALTLDFAALEDRSAQFEALGFAVLSEGAMRTDTHKIPTFIRYLRHPDGHFAEIFQYFPPGAHPPIHCGLVSTFGDGWMLRDSTMRPNWLLWYLRLKRVPTKRHDLATSTHTLWQSHRERCAWASQTLNRPITPLSLPEYLSVAGEEIRQMRPLSLKRSIWWGTFHYLLLRPRNGEWWGDLTPPAKAAPSGP